MQGIQISFLFSSLSDILELSSFEPDVFRSHSVNSSLPGAPCLRPSWIVLPVDTPSPHFPNNQKLPTTVLFIL